MKSRINRRDVLKLAGLLPIGLAAPRLLGPLPAQGAQKNVIIVVFDALSAYHVSLYGYARETMPNLSRLAERAVVYHNHFAGSNFTSSGTASLLTGTLPWTHRALRPKGLVADFMVERSIFSAFDQYYRLAYTHNEWASVILEQFSAALDELVPPEFLFLESGSAAVRGLLHNDRDISSVAWTRGFSLAEQGYAYSLFLSQLHSAFNQARLAELSERFPRGVPSTGHIDTDFLLETAIDWTATHLGTVPQPFLAYFHFLPPHKPYNTSIQFLDRFSGDRYSPIDKPEDVFTTREPRSSLLQMRREYDEYLLYVDANFGRWFDMLESSGLLENSLLVLTSDHGELFERGISGHTTHALYQSIVRVPLLIFEPGRTERLDVYDNTSAIDVLPTMLHLTGQTIPDFVEGAVLPPYAPPIPARALYAMRATKNAEDAPLRQASVTLIKDQYKLIYYFGFIAREVDELIMLYDIQSDPEETVNLAISRADVAAELLAELKAKLAEVDAPYL